MRQLRQAGLIASHRGSEGGYRLDRQPAEITIADDVAEGTLPPIVDTLLQEPDAWHRRPPGH